LQVEIENSPCVNKSGLFELVDCIVAKN